MDDDDDGFVNLDSDDVEGIDYDSDNDDDDSEYIGEQIVHDTNHKPSSRTLRSNMRSALPCGNELSGSPEGNDHDSQ